jgi:hypothetical protein
MILVSQDRFPALLCFDAHERERDVRTAGEGPVSPTATQLVAELAHPVRLPVLLALEDHPCSPSELAEELGEPFHRVNHAVKALATAGLLIMVRQERSTNAPNIYRRVYETRHRGWGRLAGVLEEVAATGDDG